jgi:hypothetical protein
MNNNDYKSPMSRIIYMRDRYYNDEEYRNNQIEKAKLYYELNKEKILEKLKEKAIVKDEDFKKRRVINNNKYYLKKKAEREAKKEAEKKAKEEFVANS